MKIISCLTLFYTVLAVYFKELCKDSQNVLKKAVRKWTTSLKFYRVILAAKPPPGAMWTVT